MKISYLQVGPPEHGICRYGRALAAEGRRRADLLIIDENITLEDKIWTDRRRLRELGRKLSESDIVHIQVSPWSDGSWGRGWHALANLWTFRRHCRAPLVVTLHGVTALEVGRTVQTSLVRETVRGFLHLGARLLKQVAKGRLRRDQLFSGLWEFDVAYRFAVARLTSRSASLLLVLTKLERNLLEAAGIANSVLIPHFVEDLPDPVPASGTGTPAAPGLIKTLVVAGFILYSKGHHLLLDAMKLLPDVRVVFVGGPGVGAAGREQYSQITSRLREMGIEDRVEVTGYLSDDEFWRRLRMADLAVCPFIENKSASGSLSTLIAAGCPVLASDIPLIAEYNAMVPGAILTFSPYTAEALAASIACLLTMPRSELAHGLAKLRKLLSIASIYNQHFDSYQRVLASRA